MKLIQAWLRWRGERLLPARSQVHLPDVSVLLSSLALLEIVDANTVRFRVAGGQLRDYAGMELTGRNLAELTSSEHWPMRLHRLERIAATPCGATWFQERANNRYEMVALPVAADAPNGAPLVIAAASPLKRKFEQAIGSEPLPLSNEFRFLDIGAGVPDRIEP